MTVWTRLKEELDRAGRAAQVAINEGKLRLELMRTRQLADKAAQAIGYAVFRAKQEGKDARRRQLRPPERDPGRHEKEIARQEADLKAVREARQAPPAEPPADPPAAQ